LALDQQRLREAGLPFTQGNATFVPDLNDPDYGASPISSPSQSGSITR
jgi:hypothetical protein